MLNLPNAVSRSYPSLTASGALRMVIGESRARLREPDQLLRAQLHAEAVAIYDAVAEDYADWGFAIKSIAISRAIVQIADQCAPNLDAARTRALKRLLSLQSQIGLDDFAEETRQLLDRS